MNLEVSDIIAVIAVLIATLSAIYARWSAKSAQSANKIALHDPRVGIYLELRKFRSCFRGYEAYPDEESISSFYEKSVVLSELFFPPHISKKFNELYEECWEQSRKITSYEDEEGEDEFHQEFKQEFNEIGEQRVDKLSKEVRSLVEIYNA